MDTLNAIRCALILTGRYNTTETITVTGTDLNGNPMQITVPGLDGAALERDVQAVLAGEAPMPGRLITSISVAKEDKP